MASSENILSSFFGQGTQTCHENFVVNHIHSNDVNRASDLHFISGTSDLIFCLNIGGKYSEYYVNY